MAFSDQPARAGVGVAAAAVGYGASQVLGANIWLPAIFAVIALLLIAKFRSLLVEHLRLAIALLLAQTTWMLIGALILPALLPQVIGDVVIGYGLAAWLLARPSRTPAIVLIVLEILALAINIYVMSVVGLWGQAMAALVVHVALRLGIIVTTALALKHGLVRAFDADMAQEVFS
jgi:hypothetical protein